ncbi:MAG: alkaline phosphatase family protein [Lentisphaerales bacterium]|jgi:predicted AlkP superfamily pyrophosphatase or phosphodiesterase|nr:MAG: alkaline phosphatase family protein [Lentisphaerales bacterium]
MSRRQNRKLLVIQAAGLGYDFLAAHGSTFAQKLNVKPMQSGFPAVTCSVQAGFRTASLPSEHGMISNGIFSRHFRRPFFWEQSAALVAGQRIWATARDQGARVAVLFWQQSLGENADIILSPAPIHKHHGGMIQDCYSKPAGLYQRLCDRIGRPFALRHYWGPTASTRSSQWIAEATAILMAETDLAPDLCFTYLPALDYDLQRFGPDHRRSVQALASLCDQLSLLMTAAERNGYELLLFGDYAIEKCAGPAILPNRILADNGMLAIRDVKGRKYADLHAARAFAMVDHQIAHIYIPDRQDIATVHAMLAKTPGIQEVIDVSGHQQLGINHPNSGDLLITACAGTWFAYPWWHSRQEAPDYASHVDIHNKPGYDPCELFWGWPPGTVSCDTRRISGSHGLTGAGKATAWASTCIEGEVGSLVDLARKTASWIGGTV